MKSDSISSSVASPASGAHEDDRPAFAASLMVGSLFLLGFQDALVKLVSSDLSLWQFQFIRAACNLAFLILLARILWGGLPPKPIRLWAVALRSMFLVGAMIFFFGGISDLTLAQIAAGLYVFPLFVAALSAVFLGEKVGPRRIGAIVAGFTGTLMILKPGTDAFQWIGLMPVGAGLCYALTVLTTRKLCRKESPATLSAGVAVTFLVVGGLGLVLVGIAAPEVLAQQSPYLFTGWHSLELWIVGIIVGCSVLNLTANIGLAKAYQSAESSWLAPFDYTYLVFATFWGYAMYGNMPDVISFGGMALIAASGCFVAWRERQESRQRRVEVQPSVH